MTGYKDPFGGRTSYTFQSGGGGRTGSLGSRRATLFRPPQEVPEQQATTTTTQSSGTQQETKTEKDTSLLDALNLQNTGQKELMALANQYRLGEITANTDAQSRLANEEGARTNYRFDRGLVENGRQFDVTSGETRRQFDATLEENARQFDMSDRFNRDNWEFQSRFQREGFEQDLGRQNNEGEWSSRLQREASGYRLQEIAGQGDQNVRLENQTFENRRVLQADGANQAKEIERNRVSEQIRIDNTNRDASMRLWRGDK